MKRSETVAEFEIWHELACGCAFGTSDSHGDIRYCSKHNSAPKLHESLRKAEQLACIATDWNLTEVEIDGEMVSVYDLRREFKAVLAESEKSP